MQFINTQVWMIMNKQLLYLLCMFLYGDCVLLLACLLNRFGKLFIICQNCLKHGKNVDCIVCLCKSLLNGPLTISRVSPLIRLLPLSQSSVFFNEDNKDHPTKCMLDVNTIIMLKLDSVQINSNTISEQRIQQKVYCIVVFWSFY